MPIQKYDLAALPPRKVNGLAAPALEHLETAHRTLQGIFDSLHIVRERSFGEKADARGRFKEPEVDLLRSALFLAGAGLDAVVKRLALDTLPHLLTMAPTPSLAHRRFQRHIAAQVCDTKPTTDWYQAVLDPDPRRSMVALYVIERTSGSLQSEDELKKMREAFGISDMHLTDARIESLRDFFTARNRIAHDLDIRFPAHASPRSRVRYTHQAKTAAQQCDLVLGVSGDFIDGVSQHLGGPRRRRKP